MFKDESENVIANFFRTNLLEVRNAVKAEDFKKFSTLASNEERVNFILKYPEAHVLPVEVENADTKDLEKALKLKEIGNKCYGAGDYAKALENYTNAICIVPRKEMAVILANRSAVLHQIGRSDLALVDIGECIKIGYPKELLYKIEERRAKCYLAQEKHEKAIEAFRRALQALDDAKIPTERKQKIQSDVRIMMTLMEKGNQLSSKKNLKAIIKFDAKNNKVSNFSKSDLPKISEINPLYPSCSKSVTIRNSEGSVGRHAVATKDIKPGELLVVEDAHCAVLLGEYRRSHCQKCFTKVVAPYPAACDTCDLVVYCSPDCRDVHAKVHANECEILGALWLSEASITCLIALRAIVQHPFEKLCKLEEDLKNKNYEVSENNPYNPKDYRTLNNLITHEEERVPEDFFHRAFMAAWLFRLLRIGKYFPDDVKTPDEGGHDLSDAEQFIGGLLLNNLQFLCFNAHEISELRRKKGEKTLAEAKSMFIGGGIYPTVSLFNHSCNPGIIRYFVGSTMIVRAIRSIPAGGEICENYGPIFTTTEESERKRRLRVRYWFDCACEACTEHWPLLENIDPRILRFKCETGRTCGNIIPVSTESNEFMISCKKCGKSTNILKGLKALQDTDSLFKVASRHLEEGKTDQALKVYLEILKILDETLALPIRDYHLCQQGIRLCMLTLGNSSFV